MNRDINWEAIVKFPLRHVVLIWGHEGTGRELVRFRFILKRRLTNLFVTLCRTKNNVWRMTVLWQMFFQSVKEFVIR